MKPAALMVLAVLFASDTRAGGEAPTVVFVCEHGSVKSLIAKEWFNRRAQERGLAVRAVSRGRVPDASVPPPVVEEMRRDGFDVTAFVPQAPEATEMKKAARVITIGLEKKVGSGDNVEAWDDIPPTSKGWAGTRDALRAHVDTLLKALAEHP
jgi:hypothetical protein